VRSESHTVYDSRHPNKQHRNVLRSIYEMRDSEVPAYRMTKDGLAGMGSVCRRRPERRRALQAEQCIAQIAD
jgi:hypothetical protein